MPTKPDSTELDAIDRDFRNIAHRMEMLAQVLLDFSKSLVTARKRKGYSQMRLAKALGVSQSAITDWERGRSRPRSEVRPKLFELLEISHETVQRAEAASVEYQSLRSERLRLMKLSSAQTETFVNRAHAYAEEQRIVSEKNAKFERINSRDLFERLYRALVRTALEAGLDIPGDQLAYVVATKWNRVKTQRIMELHGSEVATPWSMEETVKEAILDFRQLCDEWAREAS